MKILGNKGDVLVVVLVYFALVASAVTLIYTNSKAANRAYRSNETAIDDRLELIYITSQIKKIDFDELPIAVNFEYKETEFAVIAKPFNPMSLWDISIEVTKNSCQYHINSIYDSTNRRFDSFEFDD
ncbi:MAG: hypothetical protein PHI41_01010 [Erysipelotrichaceae bacterium]|nr:hypothetical protein [Erysipelotrichaceae bacterium]MDD3808722.1 hypothetical protein [Erysipelotrichaceae bacterium]